MEKQTCLQFSPMIILCYLLPSKGRESGVMVSALLTWIMHVIMQFVSYLAITVVWVQHYQGLTVYEDQASTSTSPFQKNTGISCMLLHIQDHGCPWKSWQVVLKELFFAIRLWETLAAFGLFSFCSALMSHVALNEAKNDSSDLSFWHIPTWVKNLWYQLTQKSWTFCPQNLLAKAVCLSNNLLAKAESLSVKTRQVFEKRIY